jgi:hypothetical protein
MRNEQQQQNIYFIYNIIINNTYTYVMLLLQNDLELIEKLINKKPVFHADLSAVKSSHTLPWVMFS